MSAELRKRIPALCGICGSSIDPSISIHLLLTGSHKRLIMGVQMEVSLDPLGKIAITPELVKAIGELDEFKGRWASLSKLAPERIAALRRIATIESVGSSTRIEGARLSDDEVERLLKGLDLRSFRSRDEQEVAGYADLMEMIFASWAEIDLTENHIQQLHGVLLKYSEKDERHRGHYKTLPNSVEAFDDKGRSLGVIFETASPFDAPRLMQELVEWARTNMAAKRQHPLLVIAVFILRFLAIHPFQDGNGRLSRAMTTLLLLREGYAYMPYSSLERVVEENKDSYYLSLRRGQIAQASGEPDIGAWISFFLSCLVRQKDALLGKIEREKLMAPLSPLSEKLMGIAREHGRLSVREAEALTGANRNTIKDHLRKLVAAGQLVPRGRGRGSWYELG